jgi:hypothetical protein
MNKRKSLLMLSVLASMLFLANDTFSHGGSGGGSHASSGSHTGGGSHVGSEHRGSEHRGGRGREHGHERGRGYGGYDGDYYDGYGYGDADVVLPIIATEEIINAEEQ